MSASEIEIESELAPLATALIQPWNENMERAKNVEGELELTGVVNALLDQNRSLILTIGQLERALNRLAGEVVTNK